jgi:hypothetical protein
VTYKYWATCRATKTSRILITLVQLEVDSAQAKIWTENFLPEIYLIIFIVTERKITFLQIQIDSITVFQDVVEPNICSFTNFHSRSHN